jgi:hypothetical protein
VFIVNPLRAISRIGLERYRESEGEAGSETGLAGEDQQLGDRDSDSDGSPAHNNIGTLHAARGSNSFPCARAAATVITNSVTIVTLFAAF